jgi:hypothetical protein
MKKIIMLAGFATNRIYRILIAAAIVASTAGAANAQAFSSGWGTGNVQPSHYNDAGKLVLDNVQQNNGGLSAFAAAPVGNASAIQYHRRSGHHQYRHWSEF